jgi:hypothetical protein
MLSNNDKINALQETLAAMVGDWAKDNSSPANFVGAAATRTLTTR